jgi:tripartite-type tricarboxylate transporter receptor subunit TctC
MFTRKTLCLGGCLVAAIAIALPFVSKTAWTQAYPNKPVKIIVGFPAGGPNDISARLVAPLLTNRLGQQFIVENRPGAAGTVGTAAVVRSAPDGYSL